MAEMNPVNKDYIALGRMQYAAYKANPAAYMQKIKTGQGIELTAFAGAYQALLREKILPDWRKQDPFQYIEFHAEAVAFAGPNNKSEAPDELIDRLVKMQIVMDYFEKQKPG